MTMREWWLVYDAKRPSSQEASGGVGLTESDCEELYQMLTEAEEANA